uniref:Histone acetyltransferase n=1 Tax=Phallusia mammillata TaxID=59560 RepID=A0A6F9DG67_9ASCI|nr:ZF(C2HC)-2 zinc finger protein [Phallusia mammillata]
MPKRRKHVNYPKKDSDFSQNSSSDTETGIAGRTRHSSIASQRESESNNESNGIGPKKRKRLSISESKTAGAKPVSRVRKTLSPSQILRKSTSRNLRNAVDGDNTTEDSDVDTARVRRVTRGNSDTNAKKSNTHSTTEPIGSSNESQPKKRSEPGSPVTPKRLNPLGITEHEMLLALDESGGSRLRKRRYVHSYQVDMKHCPINGCDSRGHLLGRFERHFTPSTCPIFHNLTPERCKENHEAYTRLKQERAAISNDSDKSNVHHNTRKQADAGPTPTQLRYRKKIQTDRSSHTSLAPEVKRINGEHKNKYGSTREPLLNGIASQYDLNLFRRAQALASEGLENELERLHKIGVSTSGAGNQERRLKVIEIGRYEMDTWYSSPYPEEYVRMPKLYICEFCLKYMKSSTILRRHMAKCVWRHPPGDEIYRKGTVSVFEVDGKKNKIYCQNVCLLAKLFLDHKTLYYDVEPFLFYVMTEADLSGCHMVGYFSKEKNSFLNYNVSCILTMPQYMRKGYGKMLIDFSYLLSRREGKIGSPERPLSDLGLLSYRSYWTDVILGYLSERETAAELSIRDISQETAVNPSDIVSTLQALQMLKYWKGKHIILKKQDMLDEWVNKRKQRPPEYARRAIDPTSLKWTPPRDKENP